MAYVVIGLLLAVAIAINVYNFLDGRNFLLDVADKLRLFSKNLKEWNAYCINNPRQSDIVVCLSTTPSRINHLTDTLKSLFAQSRSPQGIRLHIPEFSKREHCAYEIPPYLDDLEGVEIIRCDDLGPATKLIPALRDFGDDQKILVVDDDKIYHSNTIDDFYRWSRNGLDVAIGSSGWIVPYDLNDRHTTIISNIKQTPPSALKSTRVTKPERIDVFEGYSGFLVKPGFFDYDRVTDYSDAPEAAFFVDDVWFSAHCKVPKYVYPSKRFCFVSWRFNRFFWKNSLGALNRGEADLAEGNNSILMRYFRDRWMLAE